MKKIVFALLVLAAVACQNNPKNPKEPVDPNAKERAVNAKIADSANWTTVQWLDSMQQFGKVIDGEKVIISFHFKNTGSKPLIIASVSASCGCTVPTKPEEPIAPGAEGIIKAEFNSAGRVGKAEKYVNVSCNTEKQIYTLRFEGEVIEKSKQ
ncbi:MAG: DUF1573 domain-containing protein [Chitinophagaceae bacterium]|nr:DUF1573 domain-containing protein [Chitinophagaceae bacterium]